MADYARINFEGLNAIVRVFENRGTRAMRELRAPIAEALHAEVLEVFETQGYGKWPGFAWQRAGKPPPGTPNPREKVGPKFGPVTRRSAAIAAGKAARAKEAKRQQKKLRASFGFALGAVERRYSGTKLKRGGKSKRPAKSYRRWQGNPKLLQDTGNLVGSLRPEYADDFVEVYTNVPYAKYHVSPEPRRKIPLRDFFDINTVAFERDVVQMFELHMARPIAAE
jgi:phage gpG-like protein